MSETSGKTACVVDNGLFVELAATLAPSFKRMLYYSTWETSFPRSNATAIGEGIPGVQRIQSIWPHIDDIDLFVFPDIFGGYLQQYLASIGKRVWGPRLAEQLEINRAGAKRWIRDLGLAVGPYKQIKGITALRDYLREHDDQYVKSPFRGDMETFHATNYRTVETRLDDLENSFGARKELIEFIAEKPIKADVEVGFDGYTIDGRFPSKALYGVEKKDSGYIGEVVPYGSLPAPLREVNSKLAPLFRETNYRGFWSSEIRVTNDGTPYLIDPCCRMGSPPGELYQYLIENIAEIIWHGSNGEVVEPKYRHRYGAQLILKASWAEQHWQPVDFPQSIREHVKLHYLSVVDGRHYFVPQAIEMPEIGAVVAGGDTREAAVKAVTNLAEQIEGYTIEFRAEALEEACKQMDELKHAA